MQVNFVDDIPVDDLLDPDARIWRRHAKEDVSLTGTPAGLQPTAAIRVAWMGKKIGAIDRVAVSALHNGDQIAFRLEWADPIENAEIADNDTFPDAAAIALPVVPESPIVTMGAPGQPVNAWYWRADEPNSARQLSAQGLGTSVTFDRNLLGGRGAWKEGRWTVVMARSLRIESEAPAAQLVPGTQTGFGVAVWDGANAERAGIKAFSGNWLPLQIAATPSRGKS